MITELDAQKIEEILNEAARADPIPKYEDAKKWDALLENPMLSTSPGELISRADELMREPLELIPASLYLSYLRTGSRAPHDGVHRRRRARLLSFVIAECLERKGRFLDPIMDHVWSICEESSWVIPAHSRTTLPTYKDIQWVDLVAADTALTFGETIFVLGRLLDKHDPVIVERMLDEMMRRCWRPYNEAKGLGWLFAPPGGKVNNWNAVCNCGVVGSALLALGDVPMLSSMVSTCLRSLNDYLKSFDPDGGSDEGPSYWRYGVTHYAWLSHLLESRTRGEVSLMDAEEMRQIALFPQRVTFSGDWVVNFSDCSPHVVFPPALMLYLGERLGMPEVCAFAQYELGLSRAATSSLMEMVWMPRSSHTGAWVRERHVFFSGQQWMISRAEPADDGCLMLATKGGNNGENHNQNDLGNFIVHYGGESLIVDLGSGTYTREYFGPGRYGILVNTSWGHNVPMINGHQQAVGSQHSASVVEHTSTDERDLLELELRGAYPEDAGLRSLRRQISLHRSPDNHIEVQDTVSLVPDRGEYRLPLYTHGEVEVSTERSVINGRAAGVEVGYPAGVEARVEEVELGDEKVETPLRRVVLGLGIRGGRATVRLVIKGTSP